MLLDGALSELFIHRSIILLELSIWYFIFLELLNELLPSVPKLVLIKKML